MKFVIRNNVKTSEFVQKLSGTFSNVFDDVQVINNCYTNPKFEYPVISLDLYTPSDYNLNVSRQFLMDDQISSKTLVARPGFENIEDQIAKIPPGKYILLDDDYASGFTIRTIKSMLPESVEIVREEFISADLRSNVLDVVDARDFMLGVEHSGLVINDETLGLMRVPYMHPFVNLTTRASVPKDKLVYINHELWNLNIWLYVWNRTKLTQFDPKLVSMLRRFVNVSDDEDVSYACAKFMREFEFKYN